MSTLTPPFARASEPFGCQKYMQNFFCLPCKPPIEHFRAAIDKMTENSEQFVNN